MSDLRRLLDEGKPIFGTDGVRGVAGSDLTPELALAIGRAAGGWLRTGPVLVGRDTRRSGSMLSEALQAGFHAAGIDTVDVGVMPSGGISYLTESTSATMGAVVSASHNPAGDNGIKLLAARGTKLPDSVERELEERLRSGAMTSAVGPAIGYRIEDGSGMAAYLDHLASSSRYSLSGISIALDCANGAAYKAAPELFDRLKADVIVHNAEPDGNNINAGCGATHPEFLASVAGGRIGLAFDGDADRLIAVDENGTVVDGDAIMAVCAIDMVKRGILNKNTLVATVMSNGGLDLLANEYGFKLLRTAVGDRYVLAEMLAGGYNFGGEQSGHIIFSDHTTTGDGLLTALQLLTITGGSGLPLSELAGRLKRLPQVLYNQPVSTQRGWEENPTIKAAVQGLRQKLGHRGRVLVRASGTEPLIRVMLEAALPEDELWEEARSLAGIISREQG